MSLTVVTYGGGEVLKNIFNAIAMLMNGQSSGLLHPLMVICVSIGGFVAVSKAFFSQAAEQFLSRFMIPCVAIAGLLCVPSTTVQVEDVLKDRSYKIDHVPLFLARFAELASSVGYQLTVAIESVMHVPQEVSYNKTGMIFGADTYLNLSRYQINDADLEQNLRKFCKQCVLYDIALGRYSVDDLKKSSDLWKFLSENTSKTRMIQYTPPCQKISPKESCLLSCRDAMKAMDPFFKCAKDFYLKQEVFRSLPLTFQALTGIQREQEELISQQLMMQVLTDEYRGNEFAASRAHAQQRNTYEVMGALAGKSLVVMRIVLEALIYASFIFVLPMTLLPHGFRFLSSWMWLTVWIQLWPPFYAILNYIMQTVAQGQSAIFLQGCGCCGLSLFTSAGLQSLNADIYALAGYLSASIPFLSWAILKGGVGSFIHLAGTMMAPAQAAATSAGAEQATGNYSLANASYGNLSYQTATAMQENFSPSFSSGFMTTNQGSSSMTYAGEETMLRQANSDLRTNVFGDRSSSWASQYACQTAESVADGYQKSFAQSVSTHGRELADFSSHVAQGQNFGDSLSSREGFETQASARYFENLAENLSEQYGLSQKESMDLLMAGGVSGRVGMNLGICRFGGDMESKLSNHRTSSRDDILSSVEMLSSGEDFQKHFQRIEGATRGDTFSELNDEGQRLALGANRSLDRVMTTQQAHNVSKQLVSQLSGSLSESDSLALGQRENLNQEFVGWAQEKYANWGGVNRVDELLRSGSRAEKQELIDGFLEHKMEQYSKPDNDYLGQKLASFNENPIEGWGDQWKVEKERVQNGYEDSKLKIDIEPDPIAYQAIKVHDAKEREKLISDARKEGLIPGEAAKQGALLESRYNERMEEVNSHLPEEQLHYGRVREQYQTESGRIEDRLADRNNGALTIGAVKGPNRSSERSRGMIGNYVASDPPLAFQWFQLQTPSESQKP